MFKVGDRVWNARKGWGIVEVKTDSMIYGVAVLFDNGCSIVFTKDGKEVDSDLNPTLFFEELPIPVSALIRPRWRANEGSFYWYVESTGAVATWGDHRGSISNDRYNTGNYFKTKEDAMESNIYRVFHDMEVN